MARSPRRKGGPNPVRGASGVATSSRTPLRGRFGAASAFLALGLLAGGCGGGDGSTLLEDGAAEQSLPGITTAAVRGRGDGVVDPAGSMSDHPGTSETTAGKPPNPAPVAADDVGSGPTTSATYPPVTVDTIPPAPGVGAVLSPSGVLVGVVGATGSGYVVETPCGGVTTISSGRTLGPIQVVLDPGHGGDEPGATDVPGLTEADLNLAVARQTAVELTSRSITVALTRTDDYRVPISRRAALADALAPAAFVSIHHNTPASRPSPTPGTEVYVQSTSDQSRRLGGLVYEEVVDELSQFDVEWTARDDAGVLVVLDENGDDAYGIARYPSTPSALVEMAYLGNEKEAALLQSGDYLDAAALALADGIERFLTTSDPGSGFVEAPRSFTPSGGTGGSTGCVDPPLE